MSGFEQADCSSEGLELAGFCRSALSVAVIQLETTEFNGLIQHVTSKEQDDPIRPVATDRYRAIEPKLPATGANAFTRK